ncbi:MAG: hypothetical protein ACT4P3_04190 [Betaproteobacteria bacterium]
MALRRSGLLIFKALGALVGLYALYAAASGSVYAKSGPGGRTVSRRDEPRYFWAVVAVYAGLSVALLTVF